MDNEVLDTRKAFQPGSGYFGAMLGPAAMILKGESMNSRQKVVEAIDYYEKQLVDHERQQAIIVAMCEAVEASKKELVRTMKAVFGHRAENGVVLRGRRYYVTQESDGDAPQLCVENAEFEVLG